MYGIFMSKNPVYKCNEKKEEFTKKNFLLK